MGVIRLGSGLRLGLGLGSGLGLGLGLGLGFGMRDVASISCGAFVGDGVRVGG